MMQFKILEFFSSPTLPASSVAAKNLSQELLEPKRSQVPEPGCAIPEFSPYLGRVPWHVGPRAFFSRLFPKYGNYCGPNWSSGRDRGPLYWDKHPIDWLDYCCYCHDVGYDSHDQVALYKADLAFLDCLENMPKERWSNPKGNGFVAGIYRWACTIGLRAALIPYRRMLVRNIEAKVKLSAQEYRKVGSRTSQL